MKRIGVDIDEVLSETARAFLAFYNEGHKTHFSFNQITKYSFSKIFNISPKIEKGNLMDFFQSTYFSDITPIEGSIQALRTLSKKFELYAISSRPQQLMTPTTTWIHKYYGDLFTEIILMDGHFDDTKSKSAICENYNIDYFIEDVLDYAKDCAGAGINTFILDKPWNQDVTQKNDKIIRVSNWQEITAKLLNIG